MAGATWCLKKVTGSEEKYGVIPLRNSEEEITIGRGTDVVIQLPANNVHLSRKHCTLKRVEDGSWTLADNRSVNGTFVNDSRLDALVPHTLSAGDKVEFGKANTGEINEHIYTLHLVDQSAEEVEKLLAAWKRRARKINQLVSSRIAQRLESVKSDSSQSAVGSLPDSQSADRKRKEPEGSINAPSTSTDVKRTRVSSDGDHSGGKNRDFRKLMEQVGSNMSAEEMGALTELLTGNKGETVLERLKSTVRKQEEAEQQNARLEEEYKTRVEEKEAELRRKDQELQEQRRLQEEAAELQVRLMREKEEDLARMKQEMEQLLETQVKEKETALLEQLRQQREELLSEKIKVENALQAEFSKQLEEKERSLQEEQEGMRSRLEEAIREKEVEMLAQLEAEKQAMISEKQKVEEKLQTALDKDKGLEEEKQRLDEIIQQKERDKADMAAEMEASRLKREQEEMEKIEMAKQSALNDFTNVMENELQCSICSELFIQATTLNCSHSFCAFCIHTWLKRKHECPNCRVPTTSHNRSIVLDNYIDIMIGKLGEEAKERRKEIVQERKEQDPGFSDRPAVAKSLPPVVISDDDEEDDEEDEEDDDYDDYDSYRNRPWYRYSDSRDSDEEDEYI